MSTNGHFPAAFEPLDGARLAPERARRLRRAGGAALAIGLAAALAALLLSPQRFAVGWFIGFLFAVTIALGALFFVMLQHLTRAGWSVAPRRQMEWVAESLVPLAPLFLPAALFGGTLWWQWMGSGSGAEGAEAVEHGHLAAKHVWLNAPFFNLRAALVLLLWAAMAHYFARRSREQDLSGDPRLTLRMQRASAPGMLLFGVTVSVAAFDWLMSQQPEWYSTIFGVYLFSCAVVASLALLALTSLWLQSTGALGGLLTVEHRHDIGKLLFAFVVFYGYIAFCQYFLIWYANIPEETHFYALRWDGEWRAWSAAYIALRFAIPFVLLLSRAGKRSALLLGLSSISVLLGHFAELWWLVGPTLPAGEGGASHFSWIELAAFVGPCAVAFAYLARRIARERLYPVADPRLVEAVRLENP